MYATMHPSACVSRFRFRALRPIFDLAPFQLCLAHTRQGADLWTCDHHGVVTMTAQVEGS
jgi:3-methylfumaryl-CoA hydratase